MDMVGWILISLVYDLGILSSYCSASSSMCSGGGAAGQCVPPKGLPQMLEITKTRKALALRISQLVGTTDVQWSINAEATFKIFLVNLWIYSINFSTRLVGGVQTMRWWWWDRCSPFVHNDFSKRKLRSHGTTISICALGSTFWDCPADVRIYTYLLL